MKIHYVRLTALVTSLAALSSARAELLNTYVGIDSRQTLPSGVYAGLPNPNFGRLTFLHAHAYYETLPNNHYHGIGSWTYVGAANAAVVTNSSSGNRIPEVYTGLPPLTLVAAPTSYPAFSGRLTSLRTEEHYSDMRLRPTWDLKQYPTNTAEHYMFISSAGTRTNSLAGKRVALELLARTEGLAIGVSTNASMVAQPGDLLELGDGDAWERTPLFSVDGDAPVGTYTATFKLVDLNAADRAATESGVFHLDFRVGPPPTLAVEDSVKITVPLVTDGYVLQYAPAANGPWIDYSGLQHTVEETGSGEAAQQTFRRYYTIRRTGDMQFFRMVKP